MSQDPRAQLEQTVLDVIEHSPVGAVPHTPTYQDALRRLRDTHQVYVSADHKNGYVTVRSLATAPVFYAQNFEAVKTGRAAVATLESEASIFSRYVKSLPAALQEKAEAHRAHVVARRTQHRARHGVETAHETAHTLVLVPGAGPNPGLPGNYLYGLAIQGGVKDAPDGWSLQVHDGEDGVALCEVGSEAEALAKIEELVASAPFQLSELETLGFRMG